TGGLQKELLLFTTHADPHTHLAQDSEQLKEVTQEKLEELWVRLLPCTTKMCQQISDNTPETQGIEKGVKLLGVAQVPAQSLLQTSASLASWALVLPTVDTKACPGKTTTSDQKR
ncbi:unnamed protein product, partial [Rangifer tarandus platyrhynchus]